VLNCRIAFKKTIGQILQSALKIKNGLADIFHHMNQLNKSLQGPGENVLISSDKILGFKRKLNLWKNHGVKGYLEMFPLLLGLQIEEGYQQVSSYLKPP
jgi:hypothetical protein